MLMGNAVMPAVATATRMTIATNARRRERLGVAVMAASSFVLARRRAAVRQDLLGRRGPRWHGNGRTPWHRDRCATLPRAREPSHRDTADSCLEGSRCLPA